MDFADCGTPRSVGQTFLFNPREGGGGGGEGIKEKEEEKAGCGGRWGTKQVGGNGNKQCRFDRGFFD